MPHASRQHEGSEGAGGGGAGLAGGEGGEGGKAASHAGCRGSHQPPTHAPRPACVAMQGVPSGIQLSWCRSPNVRRFCSQPRFWLWQRMTHGWSSQIGQVAVSTTEPYLVQTALLSTHSPRWQKPAWSTPQRSVGVLNRHCGSQHSPLHSAPAASAQPEQQAESSSQASPTSTTPLPQVLAVTHPYAVPSHRPSPPPELLHSVPGG